MTCLIYLQKFPIGRSDAYPAQALLANGATKQHSPTTTTTVNNNNNNNSNNTNGNGQQKLQKQYWNQHTMLEAIIDGLDTNFNENKQNSMSNGHLAIHQPTAQQMNNNDNNNFYPLKNRPPTNKQIEMHHSVSLNPYGKSLPSTRTTTTTTNHHHNQSPKKNVNFCRAWLNKFPSRSKRIDVISRIFFPKMFALFNLVYWTTYLFREDDIVQS